MKKKSHLVRWAGAPFLILALAGPALAGNAAVDDGVKDFPTLAPYSGVRWSGEVPQVKVGDTWYGLVAIDGQPAGAIVTFCQSHFADQWQKRFEEDLVAVMAQMGTRPGAKVKLSLKALDTGAMLERAGVPMTHENRQAIWRASHAGS
jgi:hypothetical protein